MMTDPIADMLTRIRNAALVHKKEITVPFSKLKFAIATVLVREGYVAKVEEVKTGLPQLVISLKYMNGQPVIQHLKRVSTPGHRKYVKREEIRTVLNGMGVGILSTPRGIMTDKEARKANIGGEYICEVY